MFALFGNGLISKNTISNLEIVNSLITIGMSTDKIK